MILAIDPSSSRTGYALMQSPGVLAEAGLLKPRKVADAAIYRIQAMAQDLAELIADAKPEEIVIEITSGHVGQRHKGSGAGLGIYGMAVGYLWAVCEQWAPERVATVEENVWTRGKKKETRTGEIARMFPAYRPEADAGGDVADAIGLGRWYLITMKVRTRA